MVIGFLAFIGILAAVLAAAVLVDRGTEYGRVRSASKRELTKENTRLLSLIAKVDKHAEAEYTLNPNNIFAATVRDDIKRARIRAITKE